MYMIVIVAWGIITSHPRIGSRLLSEAGSALSLVYGLLPAGVGSKIGVMGWAAVRYLGRGSKPGLEPAAVGVDKLLSAALTDRVRLSQSRSFSPSCVGLKQSGTGKERAVAKMYYH